MVEVNSQGVHVGEDFLSWNEIRGIALEVKESPAFGTDIIWHILGDNSSLNFMMGAEGEQEALAYFQTLPDFDSKQILTALQSSEEGMFMLWKKE